MVSRLKSGIRRLVIRTRNWPVFSCLYRQVYLGAARLFKLALGMVLGRSLAGLYLRRGMTGTEWSPGVSDIDLLAVLGNSSVEDEIYCLRKIWKLYGIFKRFFPFMGELQVATGPEISAYSRWGGIRAQEMPAWKPLAGPALLESVPAPPATLLRSLNLQEAISSYLSLAQTYFENAKPPIAPDFGFKIAKGFLDTFRYSEAVPPSSSPITMSQSRQRECLKGRIPDALFRSIERPEILSREAALAFMHRAMERLDGICAGFGAPPNFTRDCSLQVPFESRGGRPVPASPDVSSAHCHQRNVYLSLWERRFWTLKRCAPSGTGLYIDTLFRWYVVLESPPDSDTLRAVSDKMDDWHLKDNAFQAPGWMVTSGILQGIISGPHLDTPFFWHCLGRPEDPGQIWTRPHSRFPLWREHYRLQWNLNTKGLFPPTAGAMADMARQAAADLMLSVRLFGIGSWSGTNSYRLFFLYSRILSLHLFLEKGVLSDPQNIDALMESYQTHFPEARSWFKNLEIEVLSHPPSEVDALDGSKFFYRHLPFLRRVLDKILPSLFGEVAIK